jgi:hypothetical protein
MATFDIVLRTRGSLHPESEPDDFITCHSGFIRRVRDRDGKASKVGLVRASRIHADLAEQAGVPLFDVCDAHSAEMTEVSPAGEDDADGLPNDRGKIMARKKAKPAGPSAERYPHVARWCSQHGRVELGYDWQDELYARAIHEGGLAWGGEGPYATIDDALRALDDGIRGFVQENGWQ